jgi:membrane protease YdiL (CAAX protease family)
VNPPEPSEPLGAAIESPAGTPDSAPGHRWGFGAFFLAEGVFVLVSVLVAAVFDVDGARAGVGFVLLAMLVLPDLLAGLTAVTITIVRGNGPRLDFGLRWHWPDVTTGLGLGAAGLVSATAATMMWTEWVGPGNAHSAISSLLDGVRLSPVPGVLVFLHVWLVAPLCEELMYRGLLWGAMERLRWGRLTAFVLSTAGFAIGHLEPERTVLLLVIAIPIGLARLLTGRLTASIVAHQVNNFLPALGLLLMSLGVRPI